MRYPIETLAHFRIVKPLGAGGMGEVYLAEDTRLRRKVALKLLPAELTHREDRLRRFFQEARAASALTHPNILVIHEIGADRDRHFIATEFVEGPSLRQRMESGALRTNEVVDVAIQVARALVAAHRAGIVHRDIKPENVMLSDDGHVKVLDFGLAKLSRPTETDPDPDGVTRTRTDPNTEAGTVMGTVDYMSPEQARGLPVDARSDIFSLGVMIYEALTGRRPFTGDTRSDVLAALLTAEPPPLRRFLEAAPNELQWVVAKTLRKDRDERYQTAKELLADLERIKQGQGLDAAPRETSSAHPAPRTSAERTSGTRRYRLAAAAVVLGVLLAGLALLVYTVSRQPAAPSPHDWLARIAVPRIMGTTQVTHTGRPKEGNIVMAGPRIYFNERTETAGPLGTPLTHLSTVGGDTLTIDVPFALLLDFSEPRSELLVASRATNLGEGSLWAVQVPRGSARRIGDLQAHAAAWSPDGELIAYAHERDLLVARHDGSAWRKLATLDGQAQSLRFSPDGERLRFTRATMSEQSLWEIDLDGGDARPLLPGWSDGSECCGDFTPDGRYFVFHSRRSGLGTLWATAGAAQRDRRARTEPVQLTFGPPSLRQPTVSSDGKRVYAIREERKGELVAHDAEERAWRPYLSGIPAQYVAFSRDGQWMAYVTFPEGTLWRSRIDGKDKRQLTFAPMAAYHPSWSPDGTRIAFGAAFPGKPWKVHLVSAEGGPAQQLVAGEREERTPNWSPDGRSILFGVGGGDKKKSEIRVFDVATRKESKLPGSDGKFSPRWSPDGTRIVAITAPEGPLLLYDVAKNNWSRLTRQAGHWPQWSRESSHVLFVAGSVVNRVRIDDGTVEAVASLRELQRAPPKEFGFWMGLSPDDAPLMLRQVGAEDLYALEWQVP